MQSTHQSIDHHTGATSHLRNNDSTIQDSSSPRMDNTATYNTLSPRLTESVDAGLHSLSYINDSS